MASQKTTSATKFPPVYATTTDEFLKPTNKFERTKAVFGIYQTAIQTQPTTNVAPTTPSQVESKEETTLFERNTQTQPTKSDTAKVRKRKADKETTDNVDKENKEPAPKRQKTMTSFTESIIEHLASDNSDDPLNSPLPFMTTEVFKEKSRELLREHGHDSQTCGCGKSDIDADADADADKVDKVDKVDQVFILKTNKHTNEWIPSPESSLSKDIVITLDDEITPLYVQDQVIYNTPIAEGDLFPVCALGANKDLTCKLVTLEPNNALSAGLKERASDYYAKIGFKHCYDENGTPINMYGPDQHSIELSTETNATDEDATVQYANDSFFVKDLPVHRVEIDHNIIDQTNFVASYDLNPGKTHIVRTVQTGSSYKQLADDIDNESGENIDGDIFYRGELAVNIPRERVELEIADTMSRKVLASYTLNNDNTITRSVKTLKDCPVNGESEEKLVVADSPATQDTSAMDVEEPVQTTEVVDNSTEAQDTNTEKAASNKSVESSPKAKSVAAEQLENNTKSETDNASSGGFVTAWIGQPASKLLSYFSRKTT